MPRSGRLRSFIREYEESPRLEKISFIPPFLILALEIILIIHAIAVQEIYIVILTLILLVISLIEIILVSLEMHEHYKRSNFDRILTIKLDDFIIEKKEKDVKKLVEDFIEINPQYNNHRNEIYHTTCQILETHKKEAIEKDLTNKLKTFIRKKRGRMSMKYLLRLLKKYPKFKRYRSEIYEKTCQILASSKGEKIIVISIFSTMIK